MQFDFTDQFQKFQFIAIPEANQLFQLSANIQFNQLMTKANGMTQYLVEEINEDWHFAAHFKNLTYTEKIKAMLETYELFIIGMMHKLKLVNIAKNLYYFVSLGSIKTKINACACIMNDQEFVSKNITSMCMFLQSFKCKGLDNEEQDHADEVKSRQGVTIQEIKDEDKYNFLIVFTNQKHQQEMHINEKFMEALALDFNND